MKIAQLYFFSFILFLILPDSQIFPQDVDIVSYLKQIESGEKENVEKELPGLKTKYPNSPSVLFLEGILTENGQDAVSIYSKIVNSYPQSKYADASLYRIYSYYYAIGLYDAAKKHLSRLKKEYPSSPYIKISDKNIPSEDEIVDFNKKENETTKPPANYTIQAGAFGKLQNAQSLKKDFTDSGFKSGIKDKTIGGTVFHVVYVGEFISEDEAKNFLQVLNKEYKLDGRVIKMEEANWLK
ncbi:MAG TPA: SPOR domain-containing protein [Ignavibacteriaceae bacterium]|nr:SPOR domain-containing protein [Ignavibacteriaceae bacterium]